MNKKNLRRKGEKGITLIALIITIILLLILAVVAIRAVSNDGIISHAKNAQTGYEQAQKAENEQLLKYEYELLKSQQGTTDTFGEYLIEEQYGVSVGDFVNYDSGIDNYDDEYGWRILGAENGSLLLMSAKSVGEMELSGKDGYLNAITNLNAMCADYGGGTFAVGARSLKVEDINRLTGYNPEKADNGNPYLAGEIKEYGNEVTYTISNGYVAYSGTNEVGSDGTAEKQTSYVGLDGNALAGTNTATEKSDYYWYNITTLVEPGTEGAENIAIHVNGSSYNMLKLNYPENAKIQPTWLANQSVCTNKGYVSWGIRDLWGVLIGRETLYKSNLDSIEPKTGYVRAVVYLEPGVELKKADTQKEVTLTSEDTSGEVLGTIMVDCWELQ